MLLQNIYICHVIEPKQSKYLLRFVNGINQWRTGSEFFTGHGGLKGALLFTNTEGFRYIFAKGALFQQKWGPF